MAKRNKHNSLAKWEVPLVKAMIVKKVGNDQDILTYFTRPTRSINHARISDIRNGRKHTNVKVASDEELDRFLKTWPQIDWNTGLHLFGDELLIKAREAMLLAVQSYNNPKTHFRSEVFIVTAIIAWTYLLHAHFKSKRIDYRYRKKKADGADEIVKTKHGADKHWELSECLKHAQCPLKDGTKRNIEFLTVIRHEIEHQMTTRIDDALSAKLQACCLNFNRTLKELFGERYGLDADLSFALQFSSLNPDQTKALLKEQSLPAHIEAARASFEDGMTEEEYGDPHYAYRVLYVPKIVNKKFQADEVIEFVAGGSEVAGEINKVFLKEVDRRKYRPGQIVERMHEEGFTKFNQHRHTVLWKALDAKKSDKGYGVETESDGWRWYEKWVDAVRQHCTEHKDKYV